MDPLAGGVVSFPIAKKRLSEGTPLQANLIIAHDQSEADTLISLARAHAVTDKAAVVCRFQPTKEASSMQLPSIGPRGQRQVRAWLASAANIPERKLSAPNPQRLR